MKFHLSQNPAEGNVALLPFAGQVLRGRSEGWPGHTGSRGGDQALQSLLGLGVHGSLWGWDVWLQLFCKIRYFKVLCDCLASSTCCKHSASLVTVKAGRIFYWLALDDGALWEQKAAPPVLYLVTSGGCQGVAETVILKLSISKWIFLLIFLCIWRFLEGRSMEAFPRMSWLCCSRYGYLWQDPS